MNGDAELPHRSSSPLKRRASSMDPEADVGVNGDTDMGGSKPSTRLPRAMSVDAPDATNSGHANGTDSSTTQVPPPILEQVKIIEMLLRAFAESPAKEGDKAYLVARSWVDRALALRSDSKQPNPDVGDTPLGPVDNSDIIQEVIQEPGREPFTRLKPGSDQESFELFPEDAWKLVMDWYGMKEGQTPIVRTAINTAPDPQSEANVLYEYHPPVFHVHRLWSEWSPIPIEQSLKSKNPPPVVVIRSRKYRAQSFIKDIKGLTGISLDRKIRLWTIPQQLPAGGNSESRPALTPPDSPGRAQSSGNSQSLWPSLLVDTVSFSKVRDTKLEVPLSDQTTNTNYNGSAPLQLFELVTDQTLVLEESVDSGWVSTCTSRSRNPEKAIPTRVNANSSTSKPSSNRSSPGPEGSLTRGRMQKKGYGRSIGAVGLHNLGNTCYMNSALQCVRSVEELTKFFLTDTYSDELNKGNPLGYNGKVAMAYGSLLKEIYDEGRGAVSPRDFKNTVGRCRSTFSGWGQQDSQEFLGFLLDGLQEDLSRVKKKPYIEKPDSTDDMINNPEAIREMADKVWDITRKRDDSVIADLFTGMYKSTLKCPECGKISITFDPFNNLTLPLPLENMWTATLKFFPLNDVPVKIEAELPKHSSIEGLKQFLSIRTGVPVDRLMGAEEFKDRFFKIYDNSQDISEEIQHSDIPTFHELEAVPTNWPGKGPQKKARSMLDIDTPLDSAEWDDPRYDTMVIPVLHRRPQASGRGSEGVSPPHFITLTREELSNYDMIQRKVLEKVSTFSTWSKLRVPSGSESGDTDMVITTSSDADSSGDGKVAAKSVEGEDDMVDVTMKDVDEGAVTSLPPLPNQPQILKRFNTRRSGFVRPDQPLEPEFHNMFELSYFANSTDGAIPTGWSSVDNTRTLPKLSDRIPEPQAKDDDEASPESWNSAASGNDESSNDEEVQTEPSQTRMVDESTDEDMPHGARMLNRATGTRQQQKPGAGGRKKFKGHKTYGKKGNKRRDKQARGSKQGRRMSNVNPQPMPPAVADGGPLIRLHEGLVVDWNEEAWETVFGNVSKKQQQEDSFQGARTFIDLDVLNDTALKINQRRRQTRRSRGVTLDECLDEFERAEVLSEQDMWYCPRCKEHRRASKKFDLWKTPDILVAHLKRFSSSGWRRDKLDALVDFPIEGLDLTSRVIQKEVGVEEIYDLIAVDDHYGGLGGGHYTAYAKNFVDGRWYNYNDSSATPVSDPSSVVTSAAYLLFYRRRTSGHLGGPRFAQIFEKYASDTSGEDEPSESGDRDRGALANSLKVTGDSTTVNPSTGDLPSYDSATNTETIHDSIEDGGSGLSNGFKAAGLKSLDMTQSWSFTGLDGSGAEGSTVADYASDDAQFDSSGDERRASQEFFESDTVMDTTGTSKYFKDGSASSPSSKDIDAQIWQGSGVVSVPAIVGDEEGSDEVAEIHLEGDHTLRDE